MGDCFTFVRNDGMGIASAACCYKSGEINRYLYEVDKVCDNLIL